MVVGVGEVEAAAAEAVEGALGDEGLRVGILTPNSALTVLSVSAPRSPHRHERRVSDRLRQIRSTRRLTAGFQSCGEVTAVSRNSGTRRTREDSRGHDELGD